MGIARFSSEVNGCAEAKEAKKDASASYGIQKFRTGASFDGR